MLKEKVTEQLKLKTNLKFFITVRWNSNRTRYQKTGKSSVITGERYIAVLQFSKRWEPRPWEILLTDNFRTF